MKEKGGLKKKEVDELAERLDRLESILGEISRPLSSVQNITSAYFRLLNMYSEHGSISPELIVPEIKDPISRDIINILFQRSALNVSQVTEALKKRRGKASRRIVRAKLLELEKGGVVVGEREGSRRTYSVSEELLKKWSQLLGFYK